MTGGGMDLFGGGGGPTSKEFGRSSAESVIGGDIRGLTLDSATLMTIAAVGGVVLLIFALMFSRR